MCAPWGLVGGGAGVTSLNYVRDAGDKDFKTMDPVHMSAAAGSSVRVATAGGGGWGDPLERDPARVLEDVVDDFVSLDSAREDYGVVIDADAGTVDLKATEETRARMRTTQGEAGNGER
jgi:N-methylhydantoinase B